MHTVIVNGQVVVEAGQWLKLTEQSLVDTVEHNGRELVRRAVEKEPDLARLSQERHN